MPSPVQTAMVSISDHSFISFKFHDDDILAAGGESSTSAGTLLGRLEDGRIIISQGGDRATAVAMVKFMPHRI